MAQPGDEKQKEGDTPQHLNEYRCVFRESADSLYILLKNSKTKRAFTNTFTKSTLKEMDLKQPIKKIISLLEESYRGKPELSFKVAFGDAENTKQQIFANLYKDYAKGYALYIFVGIDNSYFSAQYAFKLLEQEQSELDILRDIITDMQDEIAGLNALKKRGQTGVAAWYTEHTGGGNLPMLGALLEPTLDGMVTLSADKTTIIIGTNGLYRISMEVNFTAATGSSHYIHMQVNGSNIGSRMGSANGGFGHISRVVRLNTDDKVTFNTNHVYQTTKDYNCFTVEKI
mmetsp:Transcript_22682/g.36414  ORF Transcript_22682/g.36414 Transcript_22682/m.36414 type:complete len:286 (+) Transcript_22682:60-917(+)